MCPLAQRNHAGIERLGEGAAAALEAHKEIVVLQAKGEATDAVGAARPDVDHRLCARQPIRLDPRRQAEVGAQVADARVGGGDQEIVHTVKVDGVAEAPAQPRNRAGVASAPGDVASVCERGVLKGFRIGGFLKAGEQQRRFGFTHLSFVDKHSGVVADVGVEAVDLLLAVEDAVAVVVAGQRIRSRPTEQRRIVGVDAVANRPADHFLAISEAVAVAVGQVGVRPQQRFVTVAQAVVVAVDLAGVGVARLLHGVGEAVAVAVPAAVIAVGVEAQAVAVGVDQRGEGQRSIVRPILAIASWLSASQLQRVEFVERGREDVEAQVEIVVVCLTAAAHPADHNRRQRGDQRGIRDTFLHRHLIALGQKGGDLLVDARRRRQVQPAGFAQRCVVVNGDNVTVGVEFEDSPRVGSFVAGEAVV